jgi:hypothetical protein
VICRRITCGRFERGNVMNTSTTARKRIDGRWIGVPRFGCRAGPTTPKNQKRKIKSNLGRAVRRWIRHGGTSLLCAFNSGEIQAAAPTGPFPTWKHLSSATQDLPKPNGGKNQTSLLVLDIDQDGLNDIVVAERSAGPAVVWLRREKAGWTRHVIDPDSAPIAAGGTFGDVDSDGDQDLVFGSSGQGSHVWWWENPLPREDPKKPWLRHVVTAAQKGQHHDQIAGDFLGTGQTQIVSWYQGGGELSLFSSTGDVRQPSGWNVTALANGLKQAEGLVAADRRRRQARHRRRRPVVQTRRRNKICRLYYR